MITTTGLEVLCRFRFGRPPTENERARYIGKVEFDKVNAEFLGSEEYRLRNAAVKAAKQKVNDQLDAGARV